MISSPPSPLPSPPHPNPSRPQVGMFLLSLLLLLFCSFVFTLVSLFCLCSGFTFNASDKEGEKALL